MCLHDNKRRGLFREYIVLSLGYIYFKAYICVQRMTRGGAFCIYISFL